MSICVFAEDNQGLHDYEFGTPEGLLETWDARCLIVRNQESKDYLCGLALILGLNREILTKQEWKDTATEHQKVFKWFVHLGEFTR